MNYLKLHFREYILPDDSIELMGTLDLKVITKCKQREFFNREKMLKKQLAENFKQKLYGQIIRAINEVEYKIRGRCFNYSLSAEENVRAALEELRGSIPQITD